MKKVLCRKAGAALALAGVAICAPSFAATVFTDTTFDLADYTVSNFVQTGTTTWSQTTTGGNPGSGLEVSFSVPATPPFVTDVSQIYFMGNADVYDPSTQGAVGSISFSLDKSATILSPPGFGLSNGQVFVLEQGGNFYGLGVGLSSAQGVFQTASISALNATDFDLITSLATGTVDATSHPSFSSGVMEFGFKTGLGVPANTAAASANYFFDNLSISVAPVPEPETYALMAIGGVVLGAVAWRRRSRNRAGLRLVSA